MADSKRVPTGGTGIDGIMQLLNSFGQNSTTKTTGDTGALNGVLTQLQQPQDGAALLQSIFQQAAGQIPRLQAAYGNAVGARSGGNSSVQSALDELLKQTTLAGQQQLSQQQQQNQQLQVQAAGKLADANRTTQTSQSPNLSLGAKVIAGLQGLNTLNGLYEKGKKAFNGLGSSSDAGSSAGGLFSADMPNFSADLLPTQDWLSAGSNLGNTGSSFDVGGLFDAGNSFLSGLNTASDTASTVGDVADAGDNAGSIWDTVSGWFGFSNGGLVGRDGEEAGESSHISKMERAEPHGYADGGVVRSGGGRRSSAPTYTRDTVTPSVAVNGSPAVSGSVVSKPQKPVGSVGDFNGFGGQSALPSLDGYNVVPGGMQPVSTSGQVGSGSTATGIPNWLIGAVASVAGLNPLISLALKQGNNYLTSIDPTNPSSKNAVNGSDSESDNAMNPPDTPVGGSSGAGTGGSTGLDFSANLGGGPRTPQEGLSWFRANPWDQEEESGGAGIAPGYSAGGGSFSGGVGGGDFGGFGGSGGFGDFGSGGGGGNGYGVGQVTAHANGGKIQGPGTGTSDSVPAKLSKGEYVISADVVKNVGVDFFDHLQKMFHQPVATGSV